MNTLIFDTETTGLVKSRKDPTHPDQPMPVQIGMKLDASDRVERGALNYLIQTEGWTVDPGAFRATGINNAIADDYGVDLIIGVEMFLDYASIADVFVIYNKTFDMIVMLRAIKVWSEWTGQKYFNPFEGKIVRCPMEIATPILKMPPRKPGTTYKWPKLSEAYEYFFNEKLDGAHDALVDVRATARVYYHLLDSGYFAEKEHQFAGA